MIGGKFSKMPKTPKDHFVPQMIMKRFAFNGQNVYYYDKENPTLIEIRNPSSIACEKNFYTCVIDGIPSNIYDVKMKKLESQASEILDSIEKRISSASRRYQESNIYSIEERQKLKEFFTTLFFRGIFTKTRLQDLKRSGPFKFRHTMSLHNMKHFIWLLKTKGWGWFIEHHRFDITDIGFYCIFNKPNKSYVLGIELPYISDSNGTWRIYPFSSKIAIALSSNPKSDPPPMNDEKFVREFNELMYLTNSKMISSSSQLIKSLAKKFDGRKNIKIR